MPSKIRRLLTLGASASAMTLLAACAGPARHENAADVARAAALRESGYRPRHETASPSVALQRWIVRGEPMAVELLFPDGAGGTAPQPLIVYLPGMGESAQGGLQWRQAWARAGYAVLSVQPLAADAQAWSSELARAADFKGLARERRADPALQARLGWLMAVMEEARRRGAAGDTPWRNVDFARLGLAGYELGTQAVFAAAGMLHPAALLAISPLSDAPAGRPLLVVGAERDRDPTGLIAEPLAVRAGAAFAAPGEGHHLLMLSRATHAQLAGSGLEDPEALADRRWRGSAPGGGGRRRGDDGAAPSAPSSLQDGGPAGIAIETTTTAFWDATLRGDAHARAWLADGAAAAWLRGVAVWDRR